MPHLTGPRLLTALMVMLYLLFLAWYGGRGTPMDKTEVEQRLAAITASTGGAPQGVGQARGEVIEELRRLAASDDGNEFFMLNLIRYRPKALYPPGAPYGDNALEADARYSRALAPYLVRYAGVPVFMGTPSGRFLDKAGDTEWQRIVIVRYRSRRDLFNMVADVAPLDVAVHKWASIEKTHVFPVQSDFSLVAVRSTVAALLAAVGLVLHGLLRRRHGYRRRVP